MMDRTTLIEELVAQTEMPRDEVALLVDTVFESVAAGLQDVGRVHIPGLGTFSVEQRPARTTVNPMDGSTVALPASRTVAFTPDEVFLKQLRQHRTESTAEVHPTEAGQAPTAEQLERAHRELRSQPVTLTLRGEFNARDEFDRNLINAPVFASSNRPPDLPIEQEMLDALNRAVDGVVNEVLRERGVVASRIQERRGEDSGVHIDVRLNGGNGLGGNYHGLQIAIEVASVADADVTFGRARSRVAIDQERSAQLGHLRAAFEHTWTSALIQFDQKVADSIPPRRELTLAVDLKGLDELQRRFVEDELVACLVDLGRSLEPSRTVSDPHESRCKEGPQRPSESTGVPPPLEPSRTVSDPHESRCKEGPQRPSESTGVPPPLEPRSVDGERPDELVHVITYRLQRDDPQETEAEYLEWYAHQIEREAGAHGKHRCSLWKTALAGWTTRTSVDLVAGRIEVWWDP